jgi:hypothetical protein
VAPAGTGARGERIDHRTGGEPVHRPAAATVLDMVVLYLILAGAARALWHAIYSQNYTGDAGRSRIGVSTRSACAHLLRSGTDWSGTGTCRGQDGGSATGSGCTAPASLPPAALRTCSRLRILPRSMLMRRGTSPGAGSHRRAAHRPIRRIGSSTCSTARGSCATWTGRSSSSSSPGPTGADQSRARGGRNAGPIAVVGGCARRSRLRDCRLRPEHAGFRRWDRVRTGRVIPVCAQAITRIVSSCESAGSGSTMPAFTPLTRYSTASAVILSPGSRTGIPGG